MVPKTLSTKLQHYQPSAEAIELVNSVPIVLLVGISGAGKDTIKHELLKLPRYHHIVSHTTRAPRRNQGILEQDGVDYHFVDYVTAENMVDNRGYIEANHYSNNVYGTSVGEFQLSHDEEKIAITDLEVQGVDEYMIIAPQSVRPVFLLPPSYEAWRQRVVKRYGNDHRDHTEDLKVREQTAKRELEHLLEVDYFFAVINDDLQETITQVDAIAQGASQSEAEKMEARKLAQNILAHFKTV